MTQWAGQFRPMPEISGSDTDMVIFEAIVFAYLPQLGRGPWFEPSLW